VKTSPPPYPSWRRDAADRLATAAGVLSALLVVDVVRRGFVPAVSVASGSLLSLARALKADTLQPWPTTSATDVLQRLQPPLRELRILVRWEGLLTTQALEDVVLVMNDLEELQREARALLGLADASKAVPCA
jgi:hypothetical protein